MLAELENNYLDAERGQQLDRRKHIRRITSESVELGYDERIPCPQLAQQDAELLALGRVRLAAHDVGIPVFDQVPGTLNFKSLIVCGLIRCRDTPVTKDCHDPFKCWKT